MAFGRNKSKRNDALDKDEALYPDDPAPEEDESNSKNQDYFDDDNDDDDDYQSDKSSDRDDDRSEDDDDDDEERGVVDDDIEEKFDDDDDKPYAINETATQEDSFQGSSGSTSTRGSGGAAAGHTTKQRMTVLFLFVLGVAIGFFFVFGLGSRKQRNDKDKSIDTLSTLVPTSSPVAISPTPGEDIFADPITPTLQPTATATEAPTDTDSVLLEPLEVNITNATISLQGLNETLDDAAQATLVQEFQDFYQNISALQEETNTTISQRQRSLRSITIVQVVMVITGQQITNNGVLLTYSMSIRYLVKQDEAPPVETLVQPLRDTGVMQEFASILRQSSNRSFRPLRALVLFFAFDASTETPSTLAPTTTEATAVPEPTTNAPTTPATSPPTEPATTQAPTAAATNPPTEVVTTEAPTTAATETPTASPTTPQPTVPPTPEPTEPPTPEPTVPPTEPEDPTPPSNSIVYGLQPDCNVQDDTAFNICLDISSESGQVEEWFSEVVSAKERWERVITKDRWGPWPKSFLEHDFVKVATEVPPNGVDDIYIAIVVGNIDGANGRYAEAGQDLLQTGNRIIAGSIKIDPNDIPLVLSKNIFDWLMQHEMGHVFGVGTLWDDYIDGSKYIGPSGLQAWRDLGCTGDLPVTGGHWHEDCLAKELMTPLLKWNQDQHFSSITMGALEDLGYTVNHAEQDPFGLDNLGDCGGFCPAAGGIRRRRLGGPQDPLDHDEVSAPKLSDEAELELMHAAAERFRNQDRRLLELTKGDENSGFSTGQTVSYLYEENGHLFSRIIHRSQVEHLMT